MQRIHQKNSAILFDQLTAAPSLAIKHLLPRKERRSRAVVRARSRTLIQVWWAPP
jgi:hypothetical protein